MKSKRLFQIFVLLTLLFSPLGRNEPVRASNGSVNELEAVVIDRNLDYWDNNYLGYASSSIYENWWLGLAESHNFIVTVSPFLGDLVPLLVLLDAEGNELTRGIGTITSVQPAGDYSILVQPQTGAGFYFLLLREVTQTQPLTTVLLDPSSLNVSETAVAAVSLNNVPAEGYTSAEFTCFYDSNVVEVSNIVVPNHFGPDPAVAINGPQNNSFIVAIAGSHGDKATTSGTAFTFALKGLQAGHSAIECTARVSKGDKVLVELPSIGSRLTVLGNAPTSTPSPTVCNQAEFIADINVPPGTMMAPGAQFIKTWRLKNVGTCSWTPSYRIAFFSGEQMGASSSANFSTNVEPGEMVDISLNMTAPSIPGSYRGYWMFKNANGALFGVGPQANEPWFVDIVVSSVTPMPTLTDTPTVTPNEPNNSPTPSITPGGPTATPLPGTVYDFAANACEAAWFISTNQLPCPGVYGDPMGFVLKVDNPRIETGAIDTGPGLLTFPQNVQDGSIRGSYPPFHVQNGDRFRSILTCEFGAANCEAIFRLDYQIGPDPIKTLWGPFVERQEGRYYSADIDLSPLAGQDVRFIFTVLPTGRWEEPRALWVGPIIYRPNMGSTPTSAVTQMSTATPTAHGSEWLTFTNPRFGFEFKYPPGGQVVMGGTDFFTSILLPFETGTNLREKHLDIMSTMNVDRCQSPLPTPQSSERITINGISFLKQTHEISGGGRTIRRTSYFTTRDIRCVGLDFVMHSIDPIIYHLPPEPPYDEAAESAVFEQIVATYKWLEIIPTVTPAFTPIPIYSATYSLESYGLIDGHAYASKPVTVTVLDPNHTVVFSVATTDIDGFFGSAVLPGTYEVIAKADGFLSARGFVTVTAESTSTMPVINLLAGDIDNNNVIDQFDALTIGMSYNTAAPAVADLNNDGIINVLDLELLARNYRRVGPVDWQ
jgi:hypothetical protein